MFGVNLSLISDIFSLFFFLLVSNCGGRLDGVNMSLSMLAWPDMLPYSPAPPVLGEATVEGESKSPGLT